MLPDWIDELAELLTRPDTLTATAEMIDAGYRRRPHLDYLATRLAAALRDVEAGHSRRLLVSMPPRLGKTYDTGLWFPLWVLSQHPDWPVAYVTHEQTLATKAGRDVRRHIDAHGDRLGLALAPDLTSASEWETTAGGGMVCRGISGSLTGRGARLLIIDDAHKNLSDALSPERRDAVHEWYQSVALTRLHHPYLLVVIGTRWHEDDLLGRLGHEQGWESIIFPALATGPDVLGRQPGDPLLSPLTDESPAQALARWAEVRQSVGSYTWQALYQQSPSPGSAAVFQPGWWQYWDDATVPAVFDRKLTSWDFAFKGTSASDYVVGQLWGIRGADRYLLDQVRGQWSFTECLPRIKAWAHRAPEHLVEDKANGSAIIDTLKREIPGIIPITPRESKEARARAVSPAAESGNVFLPRHAPWLDDLVRELTAFPSGRHDDQVDALTQALNRLAGHGAITISNPARIARRIAR